MTHLVLPIDVLGWDGKKMHILTCIFGEFTELSRILMMSSTYEEFETNCDSVAWSVVEACSDNDMHAEAREADEFWRDPKTCLWLQLFYQHNREQISYLIGGKFNRCQDVVTGNHNHVLVSLK